MTWEELVEKVKDIKDIEISDIHIDYVYNSYSIVSFYKNGAIDFFNDFSPSQISESRTPDQMYQIITALTETKE